MSPLIKGQISRTTEKPYECWVRFCNMKNMNNVNNSNNKYYCHCYSRVYLNYINSCKAIVTCPAFRQE
jgi:hypothetical protein